MNEPIAPGELYIHIYKGEHELCLQYPDQCFSPVEYGNNLLHKDFETFACHGFKCHLHHWFANGCRWKYEVDKNMPKRPLPQCISYARFNRKLKQMMCYRRIAVPQHLIDLYDSANK